MSYPIEQPALGVDFWELTNFGREPVDVSDYLFRDDGSADTAARLRDLWTQSRTDSPVIAPGESVLFFRRRPNRILTPDEFRSWWGIGESTRVIFYDSYGFDDAGDFVNLWKTSSGQTNLVQRVELVESLLGRTFTYNRDDGRLDRFSAEGIDGAFKAALSGDIGSPGQHLGPVSLRFTVTPQDIEIDAGIPVTFDARAVGLPVPQYRWHLNGEAIPGQTSSTLNLTAATVADEGDYTVEIDNGIDRLVSAPARLTVNTQPSCAAIVRGPSNTEVTPGHTAIFRIEVRGYPLPTIQWSFQGSPIPGGNATELRVPTLDFTQSGLYSVTVSNALCSTNASAMLRVVPEDCLIITEAMANPTNKLVLGHDTWWELTNCGTNTVNLRGYRWDDRPPSFSGAIVITNDILLPPGRSAIIVADISAEAFRNWWGEENLPADLPIITHSGNGLDPLDELIRIWNPSALNDGEWLLDLSFVNPEAGVSLWFDPDEPESEFGLSSVEGERGGFRAAESDDIGSPGWTGNEQRVICPKITLIRNEPGGVRVTWKSQPGKSYELRYRDTPSGANWSLSVRLTASGDSTSAVDATATGITQRFYQVLQVP